MSNDKGNILIRKLIALNFLFISEGNTKKIFNDFEILFKRNFDIKHFSILLSCENSSVINKCKEIFKRISLYSNSLSTINIFITLEKLP